MTDEPIFRDAYSYPPRGMSRDEAARYIGIPAVRFDSLVTSGRMPGPLSAAGSIVWDRHALDVAFAALPEFGAKEPSKARKTFPAQNPAVISPKQLAERWLCSERHVRTIIDRGELPAWKFGGKLLRINWKDVEEFENRGGSFPAA